MKRNTKARKRLTLDERRAIDRHMQAVVELGCIVTGQPGPTLHHCHSGSMSDAGICRGAGQRPSDWLVIPIALDLHVGVEGIDGSKGVRAWESDYGRQIDHLRRVSKLLGYDVFEWAGSGQIADSLPTIG